MVAGRAARARSSSERGSGLRAGLRPGRAVGEVSTRDPGIGARGGAPCRWGDGAQPGFGAGRGCGGPAAPSRAAAGGGALLSQRLGPVRRAGPGLRGCLDPERPRLWAAVGIDDDPGAAGLGCYPRQRRHRHRDPGLRHRPEPPGPGRQDRGQRELLFQQHGG